MSGSFDPGQRARLFALIGGLVPGQVTTFERLAHATGVSERAIQHLMTHMNEEARASVPWHRVVAAGGAIGRHTRAAEQRRRLVAEGVDVSPAGIVQDLLRRLEPPVSARAAAEAPQSEGGRARGRRSHPSSTV